MRENKNKDNVRLAVKVTPNTGRNEIVGFKDGILQLKIAAPPERGKANKELTDFLAEKLGVKKSAISIIKGQTSRYKTLIIKGISNQELLNRFTV